ncbi:hypothetical protein O181_034682 [Austropuccinia psidii MF-1]|uniref:Uncharacterized protein n=1 Tax=Austropuccinia psidii MF-1 TaxID=1389203 RepID=A0A9Q3H8A9_9BASI|nr:hypothetical protein [Austropuccinia psidii MF-1]
MSRQLLAIDFMSHCVGHIMSVSRQRQLSNLTQSPNPFNTICKARVITPHGARQQFGMKRLPPSHPFTIPTLTHEMASASPPNPLRP